MERSNFSVERSNVEWSDRIPRKDLWFQRNKVSKRMKARYNIQYVGENLGFPEGPWDYQQEEKQREKPPQRKEKVGGQSAHWFQRHFLLSSATAVGTWFLAQINLSIRPFIRTGRGQGSFSSPPSDIQGMPDWTVYTQKTNTRAVRVSVGLIFRNGRSSSSSPLPIIICANYKL